MFYRVVVLGIYGRINESRPVPILISVRHHNPLDTTWFVDDEGLTLSRERLSSVPKNCNLQKQTNKTFPNIKNSPISVMFSHSF